MKTKTFYKGLSVEQLESLGEDLLDFETQDDLVEWLSQEGSSNPYFHLIKQFFNFNLFPVFVFILFTCYLL